MEKTNTAATMTKTQVFNVIILDRSGSMQTIRKAAVDGFNETLAGIRKAQEKFAATQDHFVSLVTFCSCSTTNVFDKTPVAETHPLQLEEYQPCCCTPLYDAMGFTLQSMHRHVEQIEDAMVVVTIITDGMENASREFNGKSIKALVERLKQEGWSFTYMGTNQDVTEVAESLSIRNWRNFDYDNEGTRTVMQKDMNTRMNFFSRLNSAKSQGIVEGLSKEERMERYATMANAAFDEEEEQ